jgi:hypothetical protein
MKLGSIAFILCFITNGLFAQQNHFIYIQTENKLPFYVKLDKKIYNSSISGYLIIPKLVEGDYNFLIGFPKDQWPVQEVKINQLSKDEGFLLKNFGENGWGLFNMQSLNVVMADKKNTNIVAVKNTPVGDEFSTMLSNVVKDPSIKTAEVTVPTKQKPITTVTENISSQSSQNSNEISVNLTVSKTSFTITKLNQVVDSIGLSITYLVNNNEKIDTVVINVVNDIIPIKQKDTIYTTPIVNIEATNNNIIDSTGNKEIIPVQNELIPSDTLNKIVKPTENEIQPAVVDKTKATETIQLEDKKSSEEQKISIANSNCINQASNEDFLKLRKKMAAEEVDEKMMSAAKKIFKSKCFTTEQVKNLAALFLQDQGKYNFLDMAYPFVSDSSNFPALQVLLVDEYYVSRFKAMIRH